MSYILEALKKAQAERQLGNAPTIHAPQVEAVQPGVAASRKPLFIGLGAGALVVALVALLVWQRGPAPVAAPASVPASAPGSAPAAVPPVAATLPAAPSVAAGSASNTLEVSAPPAPSEPAPRPAHVAEAPARPAPAAAPRAGQEAPASTARAPAPAAPAPRAAAVSAAVQTPVPAPVSSPEDSLPYLHQLPDTIQRDLPRVSFGGYMYSANPADRLLLVDKALRHEGEEVAPGLVLEKLLPKAAVMNFRGVRYRVAY
jgi:general secretion pathway protein B